MANEDLRKIARKMVEKPKGILAMDESDGTIGKRLQSVGLENTEEVRRAYRQMLITDPRLGRYISGAILFTETLYQKTDDGISFPQALEARGIIPGVKVDLGLGEMPDHPGEFVTKGLDGLAERLAKYREQGAKFAKWRGVIYIDYSNGIPSQACINENADRLGRYAKICQQEGLVPIVEPEVEMSGSHSIGTCYVNTASTLASVHERLSHHGVKLDEIVLKPNMVVHGTDYQGKRSSPGEIAGKTVSVLLEHAPEDVPGIAFLSGGLSDGDATNYLNEMNSQHSGNLPWNLTFSFGRGLQREPLKIFAAKEGPDYIKNAQQILLQRAMECSQATVGKYRPRKG